MAEKETMCKKLTEEKQVKETTETELKARVGHHSITFVYIILIIICHNFKLKADKSFMKFF